MSSRLNRIVLFVRGASVSGSGPAQLPESTLSFYAKSLRLPLAKAHPSWAEFSTVPPLMIAASADPRNFPPDLSGAEAGSRSSASLPSSIYSVSVPDGSSLTDVLSDCLASGAVLDGPIQHKAFGAVAVVVCPEGLHRFSIVEEVN